MALDTLILGPFVFTDFAVPAKLPGGGKQQLHVHKLPGGQRVIDAMGPDDDDRQWNGLLWGEGAAAQALTLDAMRRSGEELPYSNGMEARTVVISSLEWNVVKFNCIEYRISVTPTDSGAGGLQISSLDTMIAADFGAALDVLDS